MVIRGNRFVNRLSRALLELSSPDFDSTVLGKGSVEVEELSRREQCPD